MRLPVLRRWGLVERAGSGSSVSSVATEPGIAAELPGVKLAWHREVLKLFVWGHRGPSCRITPMASPPLLERAVPGAAIVLDS